MSTTTRPRTRAQSHLPRSQSHQASIQRFTKSSKAASSTLPPSKSLLLLDGDKETGNSASPCANPSSRLTASPSKKRKLNEITTTTTTTSNTLDNKTTVTTTGSTKPSTDRDPSVEDTPSKTLKFSDLSVSTPRSCRTKLTATATASKSTRVRSTKSSKITKSLSLPNISESVSPTEYPAALVDFLNLHSCFLKALSLHFAHNEYSSSADLRELLPGIAKIWKKRKVLITDLQRIVHVWDEADDGEKKDSTSNPRFRIANYGLNKICLERLDHSGSGSRGIFDENEIHERFTTIMHNKWQDQVNQLCQSEEKNNANSNKPDLTTFDVDKLPLAPIQDCLTPFNTLRKGQQRLQDLKGGVVKVKTAVLKAASLTSTSASNIMPITRDPAADRRKGLFERIKNKELLQSKLGPTLTKEQLLRRSAAQRAEDVARVLALLRPPYLLSTDGRSTVTQKKPFSWQSLIQTVRDSLRNPIPADEIAVCLDLLAQKDVAGDWIEVFTLGDLKSVVLVSARDVSPKEIGTKVAKMKL